MLRSISDANPLYTCCKCIRFDFCIGGNEGDWLHVQLCGRFGRIERHRCSALLPSRSLMMNWVDFPLRTHESPAVTSLASSLLFDKCNAASTHWPLQRPEHSSTKASTTSFHGHWCDSCSQHCQTYRRLPLCGCIRGLNWAFQLSIVHDSSCCIVCL